MAKVDELQDEFRSVQNAAVDPLSAIRPDDASSGRQIAAAPVPRSGALEQLADGLALGDAEVLDTPAK
ncbi:MAG TPA: hypothetical protein VGC30_14860 [Dokdonella sp.]